MSEDEARREDMWGVFKAMHDGDHLKANEILADGGWCSPSAVTYLMAETGTELIVPFVSVKRGGIRFP